MVIKQQPRTHEKVDYFQFNHLLNSIIVRTVVCWNFFWHKSLFNVNFSKGLKYIQDKSNIWV